MELRRFGAFLLDTLPKEAGQHRRINSVFFCYARIKEMNHIFSSVRSEKRKAAFQLPFGKFLYRPHIAVIFLFRVVQGVTGGEVWGGGENLCSRFTSAKGQTFPKASRYLS